MKKTLLLGLPRSFDAIQAFFFFGACRWRNCASGRSTQSCWWSSLREKKDCSTKSASECEKRWWEVKEDEQMRKKEDAI